MTDPTIRPMSFQLSTTIHASPTMRAIMEDRARLQRMLDFEAALSRAEAAVGVISASVVAAIAEACRAELYDIAALVEAARPSGHIAIAVVEALTAEVSRRDKEAASFVHWGATSQDVVDTALVLQLRQAIDALVVDLGAAIKGFTALAGRHRRSLGVARTLMQHALPMPFGLKFAGYAAALARSRERLLRLRREALVLQFGGAAGTLAALGENGLAVAEQLAAQLDLPLPEAPWHSHRDRLAEIASVLAILAGTCGKIARDVSLMMQVEVSEASEAAGPGRGGSSTMPHKRNPVGAAAALSAAAVAPGLAATLLTAQVQEHERGLGGWQTEWTTFPALALVTSGALSAVVEIAEGLEVNVERLRTNLEMSGGQIMAEAVSFALAEKIGRADAHALVRELSMTAGREGRSLKDTLMADSRVRAHMSTADIERLFVPLTYQGAAQTFIDRLIMSSQSRQPRRAEPRLEDTTLPTAPQLAETTGAEAEPDAGPASPQTVAAAEALLAELATGMSARQPAHPASGEEPGALMDILSRAEDEPASPGDNERKS